MGTRIESSFDKLGIIFLSFFRNVAPFATPVGPAFFFGSAIFTSALKIMHTVFSGLSIPTWMLAVVALIVAMASAMGYEAFNFMAGHVALKSWESGKRGRAMIAMGLMGLYIVIGVTTIVLVEVGDVTAKVSVGSLFLISSLIYFTLMMTDEIRHEQMAIEQSSHTTEEERRLQREADDMLRLNQQNFEQRQAELKAQREYDMAMAQQETERLAKLAQVEANRAVRMAKAESAAAVVYEPVPQSNNHIGNGHTKGNGLIVTRNAVRDQQLAQVVAQANGAEFGWESVGQWLGQKRGTAYAVISYGESLGQIKSVGRNLYQVTNEQAPN